MFASSKLLHLILLLVFCVSIKTDEQASEFESESRVLDTSTILSANREQTFTINYYETTYFYYNIPESSSSLKFRILTDNNDSLLYVCYYLSNRYSYACGYVGSNDVLTAEYQASELWGHGNQLVVYASMSSNYWWYSACTGNTRSNLSDAQKKSTAKALGLGIGLGIFLPLVIYVGIYFLVQYKTKRRRDLQASPIRNVKTWHSQSATTTGTPLSQSPNVVSHTSSQQPGSVLTPPQPTMYPQKTDIVNYVVPEQLPRSGVPLMMHPQNGYQNKNTSLMTKEEVDRYFPQDQFCVFENPLFQFSCSICLNQFNADTPCQQLYCGHFFHGACLEFWLKRNHNCTICSSEISKNALGNFLVAKAQKNAGQQIISQKNTRNLYPSLDKPTYPNHPAYSGYPSYLPYIPGGNQHVNDVCTSPYQAPMSRGQDVALRTDAIQKEDRKRPTSPKTDTVSPQNVALNFNSDVYV